MKRRGDHKYSNIESFDDFRYEKERLVFRRKLIESKLHIAFLDFRRVFSFSNLIFSAARKFVLPGISDLLGALLNKVKKEESADSGE